MNSLRDLNNRSTSLLPIVDNRPLEITFTPGKTVNLITQSNTGSGIYEPGIDFKTITNGGGGYVDWRTDGGLCTTAGQTVLTTGYAVVFRLPVASANINLLTSNISFGNIKTNTAGRVTHLTNVGTNTMYADLSSPGTGIYEYKIFGIKNLQDWNAIKNAKIKSFQSTYTANVVTAYGRRAWAHTISSRSNVDYGITFPTIEGNATVASFANATIAGNTYVFTTAGNTTFTPTTEEKTQLCDIVVVGGGGAGYKKTTASGYGGAGGAGEVRLYVAAALTDTTYTVRVGAGGNSFGATGGNTYLRGSTTGTIVEAYGGVGANGQDGGNPINGYPESDGFANTTQITGNTVARWWHWGALGVNEFGGGGGGAMRFGTAVGGLGLTRNSFDLAVLQRSGYAVIAEGGTSTTTPSPTTYPGQGGGGSSFTANAQPGSNGIVLLRFY